jgi:hypothetical protein
MQTSEQGGSTPVRVEVGLGEGRTSQTQVSSSDQRATPYDCPRPRRARRPAGTSCVATVREPDCPVNLYPLAVRPAHGRGAGASGRPKTPPGDSANPRSDRRRPPRRP